MIVAFIGGIGSGKTLSMTKRLYEDHQEGNSIISNYLLKFGKKADIKYLDKEFFDDYSKSELNLNRCSVAIDEAHVFVDSRRAMSTRNKLFTKFITQSRKRSVNLYYTTQESTIETFRFSGQVDLRLRKLTDYMIFCQYIDMGDNKYIVQYWYDNSLYLIGKNIVIANKYFKLYDTNEIIDIF